MIIDFSSLDELKSFLSITETTVSGGTPLSLAKIEMVGGEVKSINLQNNGGSSQTESTKEEKPAAEEVKPTGEAGMLTLTDLRNNVKTKIDGGLREQVKVVLKKYNAKQTTAVDPKDWVAFNDEILKL